MLLLLVFSCTVVMEVHCVEVSPSHSIPYITLSLFSDDDALYHCITHALQALLILQWRMTALPLPPHMPLTETTCG